MTSLTPPSDPECLTGDQLAKQLGVASLADGLSLEDVTQRLAAFGPNELPEAPKVPIWKLILEQFEDGLVRILLAAAAVSAVMAVFDDGLKGFVEPGVILLILILNAIVGVWQENRAEGAIDALKLFVPKTATVRRDKQWKSVKAADLVPGDVVQIAVGNRVPADMRVLALQSTTLRVDQAILNGESVESHKFAEVVSRKAAKERFPGNMVFSGTAVVYGKATCLVVKTGTSTEIGAIEKDVRDQEEVKTPLQVKLDEFGELLSKVIGYICLAVFLINLLRWQLTHQSQPGETWWIRYVNPSIHSLKVAVALAVAAIPEGLPAVVTTCLALGTRKMAAHNALVRDLPSVETLGRCTVICSDKTGTLTTNMMSVMEVFTIHDVKLDEASLTSYLLEDSKFNVVAGAVRCEGRVVSQPVLSDSSLRLLCDVACLCNDASLSYNASTKQVEKVGEATEAALLTMAEKLYATADGFDGAQNHHDPHHFNAQVHAKWARNATLEFTRQRKTMGVHCTALPSTGRGPFAIFVKGAPEELLSRCARVMTSAKGQPVPLTARIKQQLLEEVRRLSGSENALRCVGFAYRSASAASTMDLSDPHKFAEIESDLTFVGVAGLIDPPRAEVRDAVQKCHTAGIRVMVITGDNKDTAEAICRKIGVLRPDESTNGISFTGHQLDQMSKAERVEAAKRGRLFSRTDPRHKMMLVELLQEQRLICAMTGDGVNDAPALKKADIGIAMGSGTEVAKAASKMVLADDNFASVVKAVAEGRAIYNNTRQFIRYLISSNIGEVVCILVTGLLGIPDALEPVQLLWVNLVTDGLPATALGFNQPDPDIMEQPPRRTDEPIVNGWIFFRYVVVGAYVGFATVGSFVWWFLSNGFTLSELLAYSSCTDMTLDKCQILADPRDARAIALSVLVVVEMFNALNALSENQSIVSMRPTSNKWLLGAIASSMILHFLILYVPQLAATFSVTPLGVPADVVAAASPWSFVVPESMHEWKAIIVFSAPVLFIDEMLKLLSRRTAG